MGADRVIAVNVGDLSDREGVSYTMFGVAGNTLDAMMRASTQARPRPTPTSSSTSRSKGTGRSTGGAAAELIDEGYKAAEAMRDRLLPLAVSEAEFEAWRRARQARAGPRCRLPRSSISRASPRSDAKRLQALLARHVGAPVDVEALEHDIAIVAGLDRYETVTWRWCRRRARRRLARAAASRRTHRPS
jgi:NTE family protein